MSGEARYRSLYDLVSQNRVAPNLSVADFNAIVAGMEDQRVRTMSLMARMLVANLGAADVVSLSGQTTGDMRYAILYDLVSQNRVASNLSVADFNAIVAGMEDQRVRTMSLMARMLVANLGAADVVSLSGRTSGDMRYAILYDLVSQNRVASGLTAADIESIVRDMGDARGRAETLFRQTR